MYGRSTSLVVSLLRWEFVDLNADVLFILWTACTSATFDPIKKVIRFDDAE